MKNIVILFFILVMCSLIFGQTTSKFQLSEEKLDNHIEKMWANINALKSYSYTFYKNERIIGESELVKTIQKIKYNVTPKKILIEIIKGPNTGTKTVFKLGENGNKLKTDVGNWLPTVNLSPFGSIAMASQRHTIYELGLKYTGKVIYGTYSAKKNMKEDISKYIKYEYNIIFDNRNCFKITVTDPTYKLISYTVRLGESIRKIAKAKNLDAYSLLELNPSLKGSYTNIKVGDVIKIPTTYSKTTIIYVDAKTYIPIYQKLYDNNGVVAESKYSDLIINPSFSESDFDL